MFVIIKVVWYGILLPGLHKDTLSNVFENPADYDLLNRGVSLELKLHCVRLLNMRS